MLAISRGHFLIRKWWADYAAGEIHVQPEEIYDAQWFDCEQPLPELPPHGTIARKLIEATLVLCQQDKNKS